MNKIIFCFLFFSHFSLADCSQIPFAKTPNIGGGGLFALDTAFLVSGDHQLNLIGSGKVIAKFALNDFEKVLTAIKKDDATYYLVISSKKGFSLKKLTFASSKWNLANLHNIDESVLKSPGETLFSKAKAAIKLGKYIYVATELQVARVDLSKIESAELGLTWLDMGAVKDAPMAKRIAGIFALEKIKTGIYAILLEPGQPLKNIDVVFFDITSNQITRANLFAGDTSKSDYTDLFYNNSAVSLGDDTKTVFESNSKIWAEEQSAVLLPDSLHITLASELKFAGNSVISNGIVNIFGAGLRAYYEGVQCLLTNDEVSSAASIKAINGREFIYQVGKDIYWGQLSVATK